MLIFGKCNAKEAGISIPFSVLTAEASACVFSFQTMQFLFYDKKFIKHKWEGGFKPEH